MKRKQAITHSAPSSCWRRVLASALLLVAIASGAFAQKEIKILDFQIDPNDMEAQVHNPRTDNDGNLAALIKVSQNIPDLTADVGSLGLVGNIDYSHTGQTWIYVPKGVRRITLLSNEYGSADAYSFPVAIESGKVYKMKVVASGGATGGRYIQDAQEKGKFVEFIINPADATVEFNNDLIPLTNGYATKFVAFGKYQYQVSAPNYHNTAGSLLVDPSEQGNRRLEVSLKPNFGFLELKENSASKGAQVFLDNARIGQIPLSRNQIKSGTHSLRVALAMYKTYEQTITIEDGQTLTLTPELVPNFAETTLKVDANADIYVNGEKKGTREWRGPLEVGSYKVECRQENHETVSQNITISDNKEARTFTLEKPIPIVGTLRVTSNVPNAEVYLDGDKVGNTPYYSVNTLIGKHQLSVRQKGYGNYTEAIEILKGGETEKDVTLSNIIEVAIESAPDSATIFLDGNRVGFTPYRTQLNAGQHTIRLTKENYYSEEKSMNIDQGGSVQRFTLRPNFTMVNLSANKGGASFSVDNKYVSKLPVAVKHGEHKFSASRWGHYKGERTVRVDASTRDIKINMTRDMIQKNSFYLDAMYKYGNLSGVGGNLGWYIGNVNMEGNFIYYGLIDKQEVEAHYYYNPEVSGSSDYAFSATFEPKMEYGGKLGYGIRLGKRCRITPQVGARFLQMDYSGGYSLDDVGTMGTIIGTGSLRMSLVLCNGIALTGIPEYSMPITETDGYKAVKEISEDMKKWNEGLNVFAGITFFL